MIIELKEVSANRSQGTEVWRIIPEFPNYEASSLGRIRRAVGGRNTQIGRIMKQRLNKRTGYFCVGLFRDGGCFDKGVHVLVAMAFLGKRPENFVTNHIDGIKTNNTPKNLEYITFAENLQHAARLGLMATGDRNGSRTKPERYPRGEKKYNAKLTDANVRLIRELIAANKTGKFIAKLFGVDQKQVSNIRLGKTWKHVI